MHPMPTVTSICPPATAASVANEFLRLSFIEPNIPPVTQMKLQKLLFYAHAWHLALNDMPLFEEDFEAWPWGPVVRNIYFQTRAFGKLPVSELLSEIRKTGPEALDFSFVVPEGVENPQAREFVKNLWDSHKIYSGIQLSNSTHAPGEPWTIIKEHYGSLEQKPVIPNELIATVFKKKLENADKVSTNTPTC